MTGRTFLAADVVRAAVSGDALLSQEPWMMLSLNRVGGPGLVVGLLVLAMTTLAPTRALAELPDRATFLDYGFQGFVLGVEIGLPVGYITTGSKYDSSEWRNLVLGMGIGGLAGLTTGFIAAVADSDEHGPAFYILRDATYGGLIGAALGAAVGVLLWVDAETEDNHELGKDVLRAGSYGTLIGAGVGAIYGVIEGSDAEPKSSWGRNEKAPKLARRTQFTLSALPASRGAGIAALVWGPLDF
jgi:hypothetical protein